MQKRLEKVKRSQGVAFNLNFLLVVWASILSIGGISKLSTFGIALRYDLLRENLAYLETSAAMAPIKLVADTPGWRKTKDDHSFYMGQNLFQIAMV